jgi:hypothetical protein
MKLILGLICLGMLTLPTSTSAPIAILGNGDGVTIPLGGHACLLKPALALDACAGARDCEDCDLPPGWSGPTTKKCVCND